jgi:hypothetical protein
LYSPSSTCAPTAAKRWLLVGSPRHLSILSFAFANVLLKRLVLLSMIVAWLFDFSLAETSAFLFHW